MMPIVYTQIARDWCAKKSGRYIHVLIYRKFNFCLGIEHYSGLVLIILPGLPAILSATTATTAAATRPTILEIAPRLPEAVPGSFFTRPGLVYCQLAVIQGMTIEHLNGFFAVALVAHLNERKTFRATGFAILNDCHRCYSACPGKQCAQIILGCRVWQVAYIELHRKFSSCGI
jgi:hypothetical protein